MRKWEIKENNEKKERAIERKEKLRRKTARENGNDEEKERASKRKRRITRKRKSKWERRENDEKR